MLFKPKGWDELSPIDQAWAKKVSDWPRELQACLDEKNYVRMKFILEAYPPKERVRYAQACRAIDNNDAEGLRLMLKKSLYGSDHYEGRGRIVNMLTLSRNSLALWNVVYNYNSSLPDGENVSQEDIVWHFKANPPPLDIIENFARNLPSSCTSAYSRLVHIMIPGPIERLETVLAWAEKFRATAELNSVFWLTANAASPAEMKLLVKAGANPDYQSGCALYRAAEADNKKGVEFLLSVTDLELCGRELLAKLWQKGQKSASLSLIEQAMSMRAAPAPSSTLSTEKEYTLSGSDTISTVRKIPGMTLTTVFNFTLMSQTQIIEKGAALAVSTTGFQDIDHMVIENMRQKLVALGGKAESPVHLLPKSGLQTGGAQ